MSFCKDTKISDGLVPRLDDSRSRQYQFCTSPLKCGMANRKEGYTSLTCAIKLIDGYPCKNNYMPVISAAVAGVF